MSTAAESNAPPADAPRVIELVLVLTPESWNEIVRLVENPPDPTEDLRRLFYGSPPRD